MTGKTTRIRASKELCDELQELGSMGDSYEDVIRKLIIEYKKKKGRK